MCERHEANYIQSEGYQNRDSHNSFSRQSLHDPNDSEKSLKELNNDVRNDLKDFKRRIRSMRTVHWKLYDSDDRKTTGVLPNKKSKTVNQEPQIKTDLEKSITKFLDGQRVTNMFFKNNVNDMILKMKQNEKNFQTKIKNMERKIDEWSKSQNVFSKQTDRTNPPPPQAQTEHVNVVFIESGKSDDSPKDPPPPIIVKTKSEKDKPIKTSKKGYHVVKTNEYPFREYIPKTPYPQRLNEDHSHLNRIVKESSDTRISDYEEDDLNIVENDSSSSDDSEACECIGNSTYLEGVGLERLKQQYQNDVELEYDVDQLKAAVFLEAKWNNDEDEVLKPITLNDTCPKVENYIPLSITTISTTLCV
ncbi:hypothetical protein Tco_1429451 [Tanacetum coccineum]